MSPIAQATPSTVWLDEELRKEKALVAQLRDVVQKQQVLLADQTQRTLDLEDRLVKLQNQLLHIPEIAEALEKTRDELVIKISDLRTEQHQREAEHHQHADRLTSLVRRPAHWSLTIPKGHPLVRQ